MKKLSIIAAAAAVAAATVTPVVAQQTQDPFVATQFDASGALLPGWAIIAGVAVFVGLAAGSGTN